MKENFIKTSDKDTADILRGEGFVQIGYSNGFYTFLNSKNRKFSNDVNEQNIIYSNNLNI